MIHQLLTRRLILLSLILLTGGAVAWGEAAPATDASADPAWRTAKNLVVDGKFDTVGPWVLIRPPKNGPAHVGLSDALPRGGQAAIYRQPQGQGQTRHVMALNVDGRHLRAKRPMCESAEIRVAPGLHYRFQLQYRTNRPEPLVIIRGYAMVQDKDGKAALAPVKQWRFGATKPRLDQWETLSGEFSVKRSKQPIRFIKMELGGQGKGGGYLYYDDVELKGVGRAAATQPAD